MYQFSDRHAIALLATQIFKLNAEHSQQPHAQANNVTVFDFNTN
jgi:hypothetical protein